MIQEKYIDMDFALICVPALGENRTTAAIV
jgi:hypothetical protein